jgi:adenylate cyclase
VVQNISNGQMEALSTHHRKKLTIFFSDIKDFTSMTDGMEPEDMANLLNEYFTEMDTIISTYQGTLAQVTGDSLLVLFGAPEQTNDKDHALRCLNMAKDMQNKMKGLQIRWFNKGIDENFMIRCGINTGMATVGTFGSSMRKLYTAHGMQVNLAARLEQACEPGSILISHSTWALVKDEIPCPEKQQINAKGYHKPVRVYEVELDKIKDC